jgi:hypothetical protein
MKSALAAVVPSATQLQQLRLLTEGADSFDTAELVCRVRMNVSVTLPARSLTDRCPLVHIQQSTTFCYCAGLYQSPAWPHKAAD